MSNVHLKTRNRYHIFLIWQVFSQGRRLLTDLISGGAKIRPRPLNTRKSEAVTVSLFFPPAVPSTTPYPRAFCTLPSFARIKKPRWRPIELNDRHLWSHGKIGDCEQSTSWVDQPAWFLAWICARKHETMDGGLWLQFPRRAQILHQQYEAISTLFTGDLYSVFCLFSFFFGSVFYRLNNKHLQTT